MNRVLLVLAMVLGSLASAMSQGPNDPNEGTQLTYDHGSKTLSFRWWGRVGRTYFIQISPDCINWIYLDDVCFGANQVIGYGFRTTADKLFIRTVFNKVLATDPSLLDYDGDGLTDVQEMGLRTNLREKDNPAVQLEVFGYTYP